jgi:hypothetical protein
MSILDGFKQFHYPKNPRVIKEEVIDIIRAWEFFDQGATQSLASMGGVGIICISLSPHSKSIK